MNNIKCLKLISGEDILAKVKFLKESNEFLLEAPVQLIMAPQGQLAIMPFMPFVEEEQGIKISKDHVVVIADPILDLKNNYNEKFGSGLILPDNNLRLT